MDEKEKEKLEIIMKDYEILKTYSTSAFPSIRYNLIYIALATVGVVVSGTIVALSNGNLFNGNQSSLIVSLLSVVWIFFIPSFISAMLFVWIGEEERMMRIGMYCQALESKINKTFEEEILNWENFKRKKSIKYIEISIIYIFLLLSLSSSLFGLYLMYRFNYFIRNFFLVAVLIDLFIHFLFAILTYLFVKKRIVSIEEKINNNSSCKDK